MKKLFLLLALLGMVATGCSKDEGGNIPDDAYISLNKDIVTISPDGESVGVKVYSNYAWELTNNCDWITTSITSGDASDTGVTVTLTADLTYDDRDGTIVFSCGKAKKLLVVSQKFKEAIIPDANNTFNIPTEGGVAILNYQTSVDCDVIIPEEAQDWITIAPATRGLVSESINLDIAENTTYSARIAVVKVVAKDNAEIFVEYIINQEQKDGVLVDGNNTFTVPSVGGKVVINYQTNIDCEVIIPKYAQGWITIAPATRGLVSESITLNIAENTTYSARTAVIKVVAKDNAELVVEYTINQEQKNGVLVDGNNTFTVPSTGGEVVINYQANVDCEVIIPDDAQSWISLATSTRGLSTYSTTLNIAENNSGEERRCVVKVTSQGDNELSAEYTIVQNPICFLYYTSSNGEIVTPYNSSAFGATIVSNTYIDGVGVIEFNAPITKIGYEAFRGCSSLTSVTIPDSVTTIGDWAFCGCSSLTSITIPDSVTTIGYGAFRGCSSLTSVTIPDSVTTIGGSAFYGCSSLTSITISNSVTTIGERAFYECSSLTSITIPDSVTTIGYSAFYGCYSLTSVTIPDSVTSIGSYAFQDCGSLTSVTIGNSVTTIGEGVFYNCSSLTSVTIPDSVTTIGNSAFSSCYSLTSVTIPDSVTEIGYGAFEYCRSLISVTIGDSVTTIENSAFYSCSSLTSVTIGDSVTTIGNRAFYDCSSLISVTIPDSVTTIGDGAFVYCDSLTSVTIPDSVTTIGNSAFEDCESLTSVAIPDSVTTIGYHAFRDCSSLTSVTIGDSVTTIGMGAFWGCSSLTSVTIGDGVTKIGDYTFCSCSSLTSVTIPDSVTTIGVSAFEGCSSLTSVTIGDSVTTIGTWAFAQCYDLTSVTIPDSVTEIGGYAFNGCSSLTCVTILDSVTTIGGYAFKACSSLTSVTIPDSVTKIGKCAFEDCSSLTSVYCKPTTPPALELNYFGNCYAFDNNTSDRKIYVPMESVEAYKSAEGWSDYKSSIVGYNF